MNYMKVLFAVAMIATITTSVLAQDGGDLQLQAAAHGNVGMELPPFLPPPDSQIQTDIPGIQTVPEPSTPILGGLMIGLFVIMRRNRRKSFLLTATEFFACNTNMAMSKGHPIAKRALTR